MREALATTAPATTALATTAPPAAAGATIPAGWSAYQDPSGRYSIAHPPGWSVVPRTDTITDFRDPATGSYLRVDWTDTPKDDPAQDWREQAVVFARNHANYQELGIEPTTYRDYNAAMWEFTYGSGTTVHATNLGFVTGGRGYALLFQAPRTSGPLAKASTSSSATPSAPCRPEDELRSRWNGRHHSSPGD